MLLDDVLDALLLKVLELVLLEVETDLGTTAKRRVDGVGSDGEGATSSRLPDVLLVVVVLGNDLHTLGDEIRGVETDTELTNHGNIGARVEGLHESLRTRQVRQTKAVDRMVDVPLYQTWQWYQGC